MIAMGRGGGKTPERVIALINEEVQKLGQNAAARAIGIPLFSIHKYMKGIAEPNEATFEKLAEYFGKTVFWLRGYEIVGTHDKYALNIQTEDFSGSIDNWDNVRGYALHELIQLIEKYDTNSLIELILWLREKTGYAAKQEYEKDTDGEYTCCKIITGNVETIESGRHFKPATITKI
jgi:hypothetical protein